MKYPDSLGELHSYDGEWRDDMTNEQLVNDHGATLSYESFRDPYHNEPGEWFIPDLLSGSDYSGGSVTVANHRAFLREYGERNGIHKLAGGHCTYAVAIHVSRLADDDIRECFEFLDDYPCLDDETLSEVESEAEDTAWEFWAESDFKRELVKVFPEREDHIDTLDSEAIRAIFEDAAEAANEYWINETGNSAWIDLERVAAQAIV
jgi:hypothetical protein